MTIDLWGFYAILAIYLFAFFGSIIKEAYQNKDLKRWKDTILFIVALAVLATLIISVALIFLVNVEYGTGGNIGSFGQSGDYFGGILNPIFGFLTVILLLLSLTLERKSNDSTELKNQIMLYESIINNRVKELEEILKTEPLNDLQNGLHDYESHKPNTFYISDVNPEDLNDSRRITIGIQAEKIYIEERDNPNSIRSSVTNSYTLNNYKVIWRARKAIKDIRDVRVQLVSISTDTFYKKYQLSKHYEFFHEYSSYGLISVQEITTFTEPMKKANR